MVGNAVFCSIFLIRWRSFVHRRYSEDLRRLREEWAGLRENVVACW